MNWRGTSVRAALDRWFTIIGVTGNRIRWWDCENLVVYFSEQDKPENARRSDENLPSIAQGVLSPLLLRLGTRNLGVLQGKPREIGVIS
jgi:hypothetical protein